MKQAGLVLGLPTGPSNGGPDDVFALSRRSRLLD